VKDYLIRRLFGAIPVLLLISFLVFLLIKAAPGDPTLMLLGEDATAADIADAQRRWGLDQPLHIQYVKFLISAVNRSRSTSHADRSASVPPANTESWARSTNVG